MIRFFFYNKLKNIELIKKIWTNKTLGGTYQAYIIY